MVTGPDLYAFLKARRLLVTPTSINLSRRRAPGARSPNNLCLHVGIGPSHIQGPNATSPRRKRQNHS